MNLNEITNPDSWDDPSWTKYLEELRLPKSKNTMHRKHWEFAQTLYGLEKLGFLDRKFTALDVGAGKEHLIYYLTNKLSHVFGIDLYVGAWEESPADFYKKIKEYAPLPYDETRLTVKAMDGQKLEFRDESFDIVFSMSSIEHFGGHVGAQKSMEEIARVLKPGGIAAIVTECILNDATHYEYFTPEELDTFLIKPSGLELIEPIKFDQPSLEPYVRNPIKLPEEKDMVPHLVLEHNGVLFTSVMMFLRKKN